MSDSESNIQSTSQAIAQFVKDVPIYPDLVQPTAKALGEGLGGLLEWLMQPLAILGIKAQINKKKFIDQLTAKLEEKPKDDLISPDPIIIGPTLQALAYTINESDLREMFVNLIGAASDKKIASSVHPAFVEIIKQLSPNEAKLLSIIYKDAGKIVVDSAMPVLRARMQNEARDGSEITPPIYSFTDFDSISSTSLSVDNLVRLRIFQLDWSREIADERAYSTVFSLVQNNEKKIRQQYSKDIERVESLLGSGNLRLGYEPGLLKVTTFGAIFMERTLK